MPQLDSFLIESPLTEKHGLENRVREALNARFSESLNSYSADEVQTVERLNIHLFPLEMSLDLQTSDRMRELCRLSQIDLKAPVNVNSHRKYIGPVVVLLKRLTWPLVKYHLQGTLSRISDFQSRSVEQIANQQVAIWKLTGCHITPHVHNTVE